MAKRKRVDAFDPERGLRIAEKRCDECLFSKNRIVSAERKAEVLKNCQDSGTYFLCHKSNDGPAVVCRGFFDEVPNRACHMARVLKVLQFVDPTTGRPHEEQESADAGGVGGAASRDEEGPTVQVRAVPSVAAFRQRPQRR